LSGIAEEYANGVKVNPKSHKKSTVHWILDRKKPETIVTSHEVGALVSGNIRLRGTVHDGNGIRSLSYSLDDGNRYLPAKVSFDRRSRAFTWEININTSRSLKDGAAVIWFRAVDGCGSVGTAAHLLFVNNTGPEVKIISPEPNPNTAVNGIFSIAAYVMHPVGIRSVTWSAGKLASGRFEMLEGNHWYSTDIDIRGQRLSNIDIEIRAEDVSGNVSVAKQRYRVDQIADLPVVTLLEPTPGVIDGKNGITVKGKVTDNDGVASIFYSLNSQSAVEISATGEYFQFLIPSIPVGSHTLEVWAKDITGVTGPRAAVRGIIVPGALAEPRITSFTWGKVKTDIFNTGMIISPVPIIHSRTRVQTGVENITMQLVYRSAAAPRSISDL